MVRLNKIYTRTGDDGETSLVNGQRVSKHSRRPAAFGEVDELNSVIGLARLHATGNADAMLARIQNDLFDLGADLAAPETNSDQVFLRISQLQVTRLEAEIDELNKALSPLKSFILPGGSELAAWLHLARTVTRRAERRITELAVEEAVNEEAIRYINRLSDHLFVLARHINDDGATDVLWVPGEHSGLEKPKKKKSGTGK